MPGKRAGGYEVSGNLLYYMLARIYAGGPPPRGADGKIREMLVAFDSKKDDKKQTAGMQNPAASLEFILKSRSLPDAEFERISSMIYKLCGINLHIGKKELVQARLNKRLRQLGMDTYKEYLQFIEEDRSGDELTTMVDMLTTNLTYFFREPDHFDYLRDEVLKKFQSDRSARRRFWSAGCSSGEEAYTLAMTIRDNVPDVDLIDIKILATDISTRVLATAAAGVFNEQRFKDSSSPMINKYFTRSSMNGEVNYKAKPELAKLIHFRKLNLMEDWPMPGLFDVIMCRNVMIYFDKQTQSRLVKRYYEKLKPGGVFMTGHSESLTGIDHSFKFIKPSVYVKP